MSKNVFKNINRLQCNKIKIKIPRIYPNPMGRSAYHAYTFLDNGRKLSYMENSRALMGTMQKGTTLNLNQNILSLR